MSGSKHINRGGQSISVCTDFQVYHQRENRERGTRASEGFPARDQKMARTLYIYNEEERGDINGKLHGKHNKFRGKKVGVETFIKHEHFMLSIGQ